MVRREYDFQTIGKNLKKLRLKNNMTVEEVREYMQLGTVQAIYKWERGDCLPQADSLLALMELYGVNRIDRITGVSETLAPVPFYRALRPVSSTQSVRDINHTFDGWRRLFREGND